MDADTVDHMEVEIAKSQNSNENCDKDETGQESHKESEPCENHTNGVIEEKNIQGDGKIGETIKKTDESRIPDGERIGENGECSERKELEVENDVRDQDLGGSEKHLTNLTDNEGGTETFMLDPKSLGMDENDIEELKEERESRDEEEAIDEMDGDGVIHDQTCLGKEPLTVPEIENVIADKDMTETMKENEIETEKEDRKIDSDNKADKYGVQKKSNSAGPDTGQEVLVDTETNTDTKDIDDSGAMDQEENPQDDNSVDTNICDRYSSGEIDQTNDLNDEITAKVDETVNEEQKLAVESEFAKTDTTDITDKNSSSELASQKVETADECSYKVVSESVKEISQLKKTNECLEDNSDKTETKVSESPKEDVNHEQTEIHVNTMPKTNEVSDEPLDEDNSFEAGFESAKKECSEHSDPENGDDKHPETNLSGESGSVGENEMTIDSLEDKPPETTASLDTDALENDNQTENQKENIDDEQNSKVAFLGDEAHDESDLEKTEAVADMKSEKSGGSEKHETGETVDITEKESERPKLVQSHTDGAQATVAIDTYEVKEDESNMTDNRSAQASYEKEGKGVVDDLSVEACNHSNKDDDLDKTMEATEEETEVSRTISEDIMGSESKVVGGTSIQNDDESKEVDSEVPDDQSVDVNVNNIDGEQEENIDITAEADLSGTLLENLPKRNPTHLLAVGKCLEMFRVSDQLCDFTIKVKDTNFRVHKLILCATSPTFLNLITVKERAVTEMTVSSDVKPTAVEAFIHYLYTGELKLDKADLSDIEKLVSEYSVNSLQTVLDKDYDLSKSIHTQTEAIADKVDLVKSKTVVSKQPVCVQKLGKSAAEDTKTGKRLPANNDKKVTQKVVPEEDDVSRLLASDDDDDNDIDMDYGASIDDDDDDLLDDSPNDSVVNTPSTSVHKAKDQSLSKTSAQTSRDSANQSSSAKSPVKTEPQLFKQKTTQQNESKISPRVRFPNIAAGLQAIKEARLMREKGLNKTASSGETNEKHTISDTQKEASTPNTPNKNLKVRVEKLPPNINTNVRVVVNDENDDLKDSDIEFVAEKSGQVENSAVGHTKREFTLEEKEQIALEAKRYGTAQTSKARDVPLPDILSWMTFFGLRKANDNVSKKYGKQVNHEAELSIVRWIVQQQEIHGSVNLDAMRNYALAVYRQSQPNFVASKTWLGNFFKRNISVLQGTSFIHGGDEDNENQSQPVPVKLTHLPLLVDPAIASIESQISEHESNMSRRSSTQDDDMDVTEAEHTVASVDNNVNAEELASSSTSAIESLISEAQLAESSNFENDIAQYSADVAENLGLNLRNVTNFDSLGCIDNSVKPKTSEPVGSGLGGISKELLAKIKSKPVVIGSAVTFDAKTERRLAEWLIEKQQEDGYVYRDDFIAYARTLKKGRKSFRGTPGWIQLFMRRNSVKMPLLKQVVLKSKFKTYYSDQEKVAIVQQARMLGVPHVAKMLNINSGVIHSWKVGMDAEERKKGGPKNFEKVTRSVTRAFPSVSKEVDERIDNSLKEQIKARIDVETRRKSSASANRGPDPELESEAIAKIKEAEIVRYQDVQKICFEVYSKKRPDFQASKSWVLKFVNNHVLGLEDVELLKSWFVYPEKNQLRLKYEDKMSILEDEKIYGVEETAKKRNISCGTIRFWKKYPPSPEDDVEDEVAAAKNSNRRGIRTNDFEYVPSKFQAGKKVRRRVVIGDAVMFTQEQELQLVQWIHDHMMADNSVYTDDFRQFAKSLYSGDKSFSASSTWITKFLRRNPVLQGVNFISKFKRYFTETEKYAAVLEARRFGTSYVAKKLNSDSGLINAWKLKFAKYSVKRMAKLKQSMQLDRALPSVLTEREALPPVVRPAEIENPDMSLEDIEKEVGSGLHSYSGAIPLFEREIVQLIRDENEEKGGVTYEDISRLCRSVYEKTRPHFRASYNWTQEFIKRNEDALGDINILNRKKVYVDDDEPLNASTSKMYRRDKDGSDPVEVSPLLQRIMSKKPILLGQSRTLDPQNERKLVQWMVQKQQEDGYVFVDEFNEYAKSLYKGTKKFAATQAWRILFFKRNKAALKGVKLESKYRKQFTREEKMAIVAEARRLGIGHVARKLDVNSSLIYSWGFGKTPQLTQDELANKDIEQDVGKGLYSQRGTVPTIENEIVKKILEMQNQEGSVSYSDISKICVELYRETRPNFKASHNWTMEFIKRHKDELRGVDIENMKKIYYENEDEEQPGLQSFMSTLNKNMDTTVSDSLVQIENLEHGHDIDFNAHSFEESDLNLTDLINQATANLVKQEPVDHSGANPDEMDEETSAAILERIRASKPDIVAQPKTFDMDDEKKMVKWVNERQERDGYVFTDDFVAYAKSIYKGPETFSGSQTWKKNFLRRHRKEVGNVIFRSKLVNQYTEEEREMVLEEARKFGVGYVAKQCGIDHKLIWSWKVRADQNQKSKQKAFWKGPKKATSVIAKPLNVKHAAPRPTASEPEEPLADASRGIVPEFEERIIRTIIEHQNTEGSISYEEISEISREIYQETRPNFKAGYGWIKNFLERHKNRLKNIDIENMKKLYLPDDDAIVRATGKNIREATERGATSAVIPGDSETGEGGNSLESLQRLIARKPIVIGVPKSFNAKTEKKLVVWLQAQQAEQGYVFLDEFKEYASSLYAGDKKFSATNAWRTLFFRRNHSALKNVKIVSKFRKTFTEEEKIAIVKEAKRLGVGHVSRQLDIGHGNINVWMRELEAKGRITSGVVESPSVVSESSNSSFTSIKDKGKRKQSMERTSSTDSKQSRQSSKERSVTADDGQEEMDTGSGLYSARGIVPVFEKQIIDEVLEYYRINESIKYDDISRISQNIYKETRPTFKASHNWIKDFMSRHSERVGHLVIQNAREFLTNKEKREVLAEVDKHGLQYVSKVTNISQAQLLAWKDQLSNASVPVPAPSPSTPVQASAAESITSTTPPVQSVPGVRARKYSDEEKKMYVAECEKHGISFVSSHYNVPKTNLGRWMALFKSQNEEPEFPEEPIPPEEEEIESKAVPMLDSCDPSNVEKVLIEWILQRNEDIGIVAVTYLLDFAQETFSNSDPGFQATEEWLTNFLTQNSARFKGIKFRYPEEVTRNYLQNFTQAEKDKLCEAPEKLNKPVVEIATLAAIMPHTLYDWRKNYKRKKLRESYETPIPAQAKKASGASQSTKTPSPSLSKSSRSPSQSKTLSTSSQAPSQLKALLTPKSEPVDPDESEGKSKMQEKLARIENKYNAIQKQEIADQARKDGTSSVAKGRGIPLPLVLKWMKMFPETVPTVPETNPKSTKTSTPKLDSVSRSRSTESTPKSAASSPGISTERKDTSLKVKFPAPTKTYKSRQLSTEEKKKIGREVRAEGLSAVYNRTGIPKSTLHNWSKQIEEDEALEEKRSVEGKSKQSDKSQNSSNSGTPDVTVKKETVDLDSFTEDQKKEIALETKSLGFEQTAKKRGIPTAVVIEWMGLYLEQSPTTSEKEFAMASAEKSSRPTTVTEKTVTPKRVYTEEEKCKIAEQALEIGPKETARVTGVHHSNVHRWMNAYKKRLKGRQYALDKKERGQITQSKNEERHQKIQGIMRENSQSDSQTKEQNLSRSNSVNSVSDIGAEAKMVGEFTFEDKLRVLQAADEMGVRNASVKFKVDPALIFQWRRLYDYTDASNSSAATSTVGSSSSTPDSTAKSRASPSITTSTPKMPSSQSTKTNSSSLPNSSHSGSNQFDSIVISDDEGSCSPCSNHSWQSDDLTEESPHKRKIDFNEPDLDLSAKRSRLDLNQSFGIEDDDVSSDVIDFAYTPEQKQSVVRDSNLHGLEKVSKMTNIPVSLILSWRSQFPNVTPVKTEKR